MKISWLKIIPLLACLVIASACNSRVKLGNLHVDVTGYQTLPSPNRAKLILRYTNENIFPIAIAETEGKFYLKGTYIGKVEQKNPVGMPAVSTVSRPAVLLIEKPELLQSLLADGAPTLSYELKSTMRMEFDETKEKMKSYFSGQLDAANLRAAPVSETQR